MALHAFNKGVKKLIWPRVGFAFKLRRTGLRSIDTYSRHVSIILSAIIWELAIGHDGDAGEMISDLNHQ